MVRRHRRHLPQPRPGLSGPQRRGGHAAGHSAGGDRRARLSGRNHRDLDPDALQEGRAGDVRPQAARRPGRQPEAPDPDHHPTSKAYDGEHDAPLTPAEIVEQGLLSALQWETLSRYALALFDRGQEMAAARGLILVDTKYEFGVDTNGQIILADEIHTPDSSRYWFAETYADKFAKGERPDSFDKDFVRAWVAARCDPYKDQIPEIPAEMIDETARVYIQAFETITGRAFEVETGGEPILTRIRKNLAVYIPA
uniref:phosphoribosylaminoimidazolesuccinocarboxamide synthase n=1 Tax=Phenylobacterium glaciei TaxID=2803784 RepID=A0A974P7S9_9CAUL|nr:hypothetical protein JKL49_17820 [Phenylobacterium glaciei]